MGCENCGAQILKCHNFCFNCGERNPRNVEGDPGPRKTDHQLRVEEFMGKAGQHVPSRPYVPTLGVRRLRAGIILEESMETILGLGFEARQAGPGGGFDLVEIQAPDIVEVVDGCADLRVVTTGTLSAFGVADMELQEVVDRNNLAKFGPGSFRRESDGKWMKPPDHKPPDVMGLLIRNGYLTGVR